MTPSGPAARLMQAIRSETQDRQSFIDLCKGYGIAGMVAAYAYTGRPISASNWLAVCAALGVDPLDFHRKPARKLPAFNWPMLKYGMMLARERDSLTLRETAKRAGMETTAVTRVLKGQAVGVEHMLAACAFIRVHPWLYCVGTPESFTGNRDCNTLQSTKAA